MNIFMLHDDPKLAAQYHCDKHVIKMATEYSQILCTVIHKHFGRQYDKWDSMHEHLSQCENCSLEFHKLELKPWELKDDILDKISEVPYKSTHKNHPSVIWAGASPLNFIWLYNLQCHILEEYTFRYGKTHKSERVSKYIANNFEMLTTMIAGNSIEDLLNLRAIDDTDVFAKGLELHGGLPPQVMPDKYRGDIEDTVNCYRDYYLHEKSRFAKWEKGRKEPTWYTNRLKRLQNGTT